MKDWLAVNAVIASMALIAAGVLFAGFKLLELFDLSGWAWRVPMICLAGASLILSGFAAKRFMAFVEKHR